MEFRILGPLQVRAGERVLPIRGTREQRILALLLTNANQLMPLERLVAGVWDDDPPATANTQVRNRVSALRKSWTTAIDAPETVLVTESTGYLLRLEGHELDAIAFEQSVSRANQALAANDPVETVRLLRTGLGYWRGAALAGLGGRAIEAAAARLEERRLYVIEECLSHELALGRHAELVDEISGLIQAHPFRERLTHHLMVALYRSGRQADALNTYNRTAGLLREELGIDPGPELQELHEAILRNSVASVDTATSRHAQSGNTAGPTAPVRPAELPADAVNFAGRAHEMNLLDALLPEADTEPAPGVPIVLITGMGGVGKTALAIHWGHRVSQRFPDGQIHVNLHGYGQAPPTRPIDALATTLRMLGTSADQIPVESEESARLLRSLVAGKNMLFVLDNAASAEQVRPLLPGSPGCLVIVTSRDQLPGLVASHGARRVTLGPLTEGDAMNLLSSTLGSVRVAAEPQAAAELVRVCASLPLALRIAAANLDSAPQRSITDYLQRLQGDRLAALSIDGDTQAVQTVFDASYRALPTANQRVFRLLGLTPGSDIAAGAVAALAGVSLEQAARLVDRLTAANLVHRNATERVAMHDLLRLYAKQCAKSEDGEQECQAAVEKLLGWYLEHARAAAQLLHPHMLRLSDIELPPSSVRFKDHGRATAWLDSERSNLVRSVDLAAAQGPKPVAWLLADVLRGYFWLRGHTVDWLSTAQVGMAAAVEEGNLRGQAAARVSLGFARYSQGQYHDAIRQYETAAQLSHGAGWAEGEATALGNLGLALSATGVFRQSIEHLTAAAVIDRRIGRLQGLATTLCTLGQVKVRLGKPRDAIEHLEEAFALYRDASSLSGEAMSRSNLAYVMRVVGRFDEALEHITRALRIYRSIEDPDGEASALAALARIYYETGRHGQARHLAAAAFTVANQSDRRRGMAAILNLLGRIDLAHGDAKRGAENHAKALAEAAASGMSYHDAEARAGLAFALHDLGEHAEAVAEAHRALHLARQADYRIVEGEVLTTIAHIHLTLGDNRNAVACARQALAVQRKAGYRFGIDRASAVLDQGQLAQA